MENYPSAPYSYPESGGSSPGSREIDLENPPPSWEDSSSSSSNYKVKLMVSYGGKIQPRSHDNLLSYLGGDTKILAVERGIKFNILLSKLSSLISPDITPNSLTFKYQLPGEDLDALISVTNDDDLQHMMHEFDRMSRASSKPPRLRLFLFPNHPLTPFTSTSSLQRNFDPPRFVDALHSVPVPDTLQSPPPPMPMSNNVDFLFGLDNRGPVQAHVPVHAVPAVEPELVHEVNRLHVSAQEQQQHAATYRQRSEENLAANYAGEMYQKGPPPQASVPASSQIPAGYWQAVEQHHQAQQQHQQAPTQPQPQQQQQYHQQPPQQQPVYMMHASPQSTMYHAPVVRLPPPQTQGYYQVQRMPSDQVHREQPVYSMPATEPAPALMPVANNQATARPLGAGYQYGYDSTGRQVYYAAAPTGGIVTTPYQGVAGAAVSGGEMRGSGDGKVGQKVVPTSGGV